MIDLFDNLPIGQKLELFPDIWGAFAVITVRPRPDGGRKPEMPLLSRGHFFMDHQQEVWTVLQAAVLAEVDQGSGDELPYRYAYEYVVVNGKRQLD
ncbi:hypothetical protein SEA_FRANKENWEENIE_279 [Streptomyces phage Frankenweenie]|nr:hypothetical protein SEA_FRANKENWEENIE_279 [Streptomyces phage Frankenweenie]